MSGEHLRCCSSWSVVKEHFNIPTQALQVELIAHPHIPMSHLARRDTTPDQFPTPIVHAIHTFRHKRRR